MKKTCIFLNLGRGPIVVEQDLYDALVNGETLLLPQVWMSLPGADE